MNYDNAEMKIRSDEVSEIKWKTYTECISSIRPYNLEKKRMLLNIDILLKKISEPTGS